MKFILTLLLFFGTTSLFAQSIADQLGGVSCEYKVYTGTIDLEVQKQLLVQRAERRTEVSHDENRSYGLGLGYTEWHLEFVSNAKIETRDAFIAERGKRRRYYIKFLNQSGDVLMSTYITSDRVRMWEGTIQAEPIYTYSIDLIDLPILILDNVDHIDIMYIE